MRTEQRLIRVSFGLLLFVAFGCNKEPPLPSEPGLTARAVLAPVSDDGSWSAPVNLGPPVNTAAAEVNAWISPDELSLYFVSNRAGGLGGNDIWIARRGSRDAPWETVINPGAPINTAANENSPSFSIDGHLLFFASDRAGGHGSSDVYVSRRSDKGSDTDWEPPVNLGPGVNTIAFEAGGAYLQSSEDGAENFYFVRGATSNDLDIYVAGITRDGGTRSAARAVSELNIPLPGVFDAHPSVRKDGREIFFHSNRPGGFGLGDIYTSTRRNAHEPWTQPVNLGTPVNSIENDGQPTLSSDARTLIFFSFRPGGFGSADIWMSTRSRRQ